MNTYQVPVYRAVITLVFGLQLVVGLAMLSSILRGDLSLVLFALIWWAIFAFIGFQFFFRMAYRLEADSHRLLWKSVFRSGSIPLSQLRRVRTRSSVAKFERSVGPPVEPVRFKVWPRCFALGQSSPGGVMSPWRTLIEQLNWGRPQLPHARRPC